jgi:hypothetical protein
VNDVQRAAIARAQAKIDPAMKLYELRNFVAHKVYRLELPDLERLVQLLDNMTDRELQMTAAYAEGLVEWRTPAQESPDAVTGQPDRPGDGRGH